MRAIEEGAEFFVEVAADVQIIDGLVQWTMRCGRTIFYIRATPAVLGESIRRSTRVFEAFMREQTEVLRVGLRKKRKKKRGH